MRFKTLAVVFSLAATLIVTMATGVTSAHAESHPFLFSFGSLENPNGIAVEESTGDVYVADIATNTVDKFDASGNAAEFSALKSGALTGAATPAGSFSFPSASGTPAAIAADNSTSPADPSAGDLYVMDAGHGVIDKFSQRGEYLSQITGFPSATGSAEDELLGLAVDATGTVRVDLSTSPGHDAIDEFDDSASNQLVAEQRGNKTLHTGVPSVPQAHGFAVGPTGDDYLLEESCACTAKLGQQLAGLGQLDGNGSGDVAIGADPASGHVYVDDQSTVAEWDSGAMNTSKQLPNSTTEHEAAGALVSSFGSLQISGTSGQGGIAVNGKTGEIYVSNPADGRIYVFASVAPAVTADPAASVTKETAILRGSADPRGTAVTSCQFAYGVADEWGRGSYEHTVSCAPQAAAIGAGITPVPVSAQIAGLTAGLLYRFRLVVGNANGTSESSGLFATMGLGFGIKSFEVSLLNKDGTPDTQAGSHPFELLNNIEFNTHFLRAESNADSPYIRDPDAILKDLAVDLPPGLVGDPNATATKCTLNQLDTQELGPGCPVASRVGNLELQWSHLVANPFEGGFNQPIFNMSPPHGVALQLGGFFINPDLFINNGVLSGGDYPVQATVVNAPASAPVFRSTLTISGVVGEGATRKAFLTLPTGCHGPLRSTIRAESYKGSRAEASTVTQNAVGTPVGLTGCSNLQFPPTITASPDTSDASTSSGLTVGVHVPQTAAFNPDGLAESALRDTTVSLPDGMTLNPSGGDGLEACSEGLAGFQGFSEFNKEAEPGVRTATFTPTALEQLQPGVSFCPDGSKIGTVKIKTPLLEHELEGSVYLATQNANPFGSLIAMYMMVEDPDSGSTIKLAGEVHLTEAGQIVTTFKNTPDLPFEDLELHFFGGERAPLSTPSRCGSYTTEAIFIPWDGNGPVHSTSSFTIDHGPSGGPCPGASLPFNASLTGGTTNIQAGAFSTLTTTIARADGNQDMQSVQLHMPPGLSGLLSGVALCGEAQANEGACGPESLIGETTVAAGVGSDPVSVKGGKVYLTGPYRGAPFGLSIVNPVKAGPFDLEHDTSNPANLPACDCVVVRAKIDVDPLTAALTVTTDPSGPHAIPHLIDGIPVQIQKVNVLINRERFTFNPTSCDSMSLTGAITSDEGGGSPVSVPFQATNCAVLAFQPHFSVSVTGKTSKTQGAGLTARVVYPPGAMGTQANIARVKVELPKQLPSRLTTLQQACLAATFNANPAACPGASVVGHAKVITPVLPVPLEGPAYFVSHGNEAFPSLTLVLQGYGVTVRLVGTTFIDKHGITSTTFKATPDVPFNTFELTLPQGPYSALTANANLCSPTKTTTTKKTVTRRIHGHNRRVRLTVKHTTAARLSMPTELVAQNGARLHKSTAISVTGCPKAQAKKKGKKAKHAARRKKR